MSDNTPLENELGRLRAMAAERMPAALQQATEEAATILERDVVSKALNVGEKAPDFSLRDAADDRFVWLSEELSQGPVVLSFYRGQWCPYCNLELQGMQRHYQEMRDLGASVYFVGPETRDHAQMLLEKSGTEIPLLYDIDGSVMNDYRIAFSVPESLRPMYSRFGLPDANPITGWTLPIPATFVIAQDGEVIARFVNADYSRRMEPAEIIAALKSLRPPRV